MIQSSVRRHQKYQFHHTFWKRRMWKVMDYVANYTSMKQLTVSYDTKSISTSILKARYEINLIRAGLENPQIILYRNIAHDLLSK